LRFKILAACQNKTQGARTLICVASQDREEPLENTAIADGPRRGGLRHITLASASRGRPPPHHVAWAGDATCRGCPCSLVGTALCHGFPDSMVRGTFTPWGINDEAWTQRPVPVRVWKEVQEVLFRIRLLRRSLHQLASSYTARSCSIGCCGAVVSRRWSLACS
jgi:hypothetical protein